LSALRRRHRALVSTQPPCGTVALVPRIRTWRQGSPQAGAEHFQQCAEFLPLRNRGLRLLSVTVLPIPLARRAAATACAAVQSTAAFFRRWQGFPLLGASEVATIASAPPFVQERVDW